MSDNAVHPKRRALVILYDDEGKSLRFTDVAADEIADLIKDNFVVELPLSEYFEMSPDAAETKLGSSIFPFLEHAIGRPLGIRNYRQETKRELAVYHAELEAFAAAGDPGANYHMYIECSGRAIRQRSEAELERANSFLLRAAELGHRKAIDARDDWSLLRAELAARIRRPDA
jgi:hypothetical protein